MDDDGKKITLKFSDHELSIDPSTLPKSSGGDPGLGKPVSFTLAPQPDDGSKEIEGSFNVTHGDEPDTDIFYPVASIVITAGVVFARGSWWVLMIADHGTSESVLHRSQHSTESEAQAALFDLEGGRLRLTWERDQW